MRERERERESLLIITNINLKGLKPHGPEMANTHNISLSLSLSRTTGKALGAPECQEPTATICYKACMANPPYISLSHTPTHITHTPTLITHSTNTTYTHYYMYARVLLFTHSPPTHPHTTLNNTHTRTERERERED